MITPWLPRPAISYPEPGTHCLHMPQFNSLLLHDNVMIFSVTYWGCGGSSLAVTVDVNWCAHSTTGWRVQWGRWHSLLCKPLVSFAVLQLRAGAHTPRQGGECSGGAGKGQSGEQDAGGGGTGEGDADCR